MFSSWQMFKYRIMNSLDFTLYKGQRFLDTYRDSRRRSRRRRCQRSSRPAWGTRCWSSKSRWSPTWSRRRLHFWRTQLWTGTKLNINCGDWYLYWSIIISYIAWPHRASAPRVRGQRMVCALVWGAPDENQCRGWLRHETKMNDGRVTKGSKKHCRVTSFSLIWPGTL